MADSAGGSSSSKTNNRKKRARKKVKKAEEPGAGSGTIAGDEGEEGEGEGERGEEEEEERQVITDPVTALKKRLSDAKTNQDHETAQRLREELWKLKDNILTPADLSIATATNSATSLQTTSAQPSAVTSSDPLDKKLLKLKRKLRQIETLEERQEKGETLEANQLTKIVSKQEVLDEISELEDIISGGT